MDFKKTSLLSIVTIMAFTLTACVKKVDPGNNQNSKYKETSSNWGVPMIHATTAGFNGSIGSPNLSGPADSKDSSK